MHYYQHHIGDFIKATARLSDSQCMAYLRLIWMYYDSEKPLKADARLLAFQVGAPLEDVELILQSFFNLQEDGWHQTRCDQEIIDYQNWLAKKSNAGKASAERRKNSRSTGVEQVLDDSSTVEQPNQQPLTTNQQPIDLEANASMSGTGFPPCPHQEILKLYAKHLPHLAQPRVWDGARAAHLKARWVQASKPSSYSPGGYSTHQEGLEWWDSFFEYVSKTKLAAGFESHGRIWRPDITWLVKAENFAKIIEQRYE